MRSCRAASGALRWCRRLGANGRNPSGSTAFAAFAWKLDRGGGLSSGVVLCKVRSHHGLPLLYLALAGSAFGAAYHHYRRDVFSADDIYYFAKDEPVPAQLRGNLEEEPLHHRAPPDDPLRSLVRAGDTVAVLRGPSSSPRRRLVAGFGALRVVGVEDWPELHCGDTVELVGQLARAAPPGNPGEFDFADALRNQGIRTVMASRKTPQAVTRLERGWPQSFKGWLAVIRGRGQRAARTTPCPTISRDWPLPCCWARTPA